MDTYYTQIKRTGPNSPNSASRIRIPAELFWALLIVFGCSAGSFAQIIIPKKVNIGLIYPISSNGRHAPLDTNILSINLIAGVSAVEKGPSFAGFSNVVRKETYGTQFAGFSNHIGGRAEGVLFAGFINTYRAGAGGAFAGFSNVAQGDVEGVQFAGFLNTAKDVKGAQFGGFLNRAENIKGPQFAGFMNVSRDISASQTAGFINKARNVNGSQVAGFINIARKVKGVQLAGFINIADSSDHPVGFINIIKNGEKTIGLTTNQDLTTMLSFRSGGKVLYGIIGAGYNFRNDREVYAGELGFGAHVIRAGAFNLNAEISQSLLESFHTGEYFKSSFQLMPAIKLMPHLEIFAGPSFNYVNTNTSEGKTLHDHYLRTWTSHSGNYFQALYISFTGGIAIPF